MSTTTLEKCTSSTRKRSLSFRLDGSIVSVFFSLLTTVKKSPWTHFVSPVLQNLLDSGYLPENTPGVRLPPHRYDTNFPTIMENEERRKAREQAQVDNLVTNVNLAGMMRGASIYGGTPSYGVAASQAPLGVAQGSSFALPQRARAGSFSVPPPSRPRTMSQPRY